MEELALVSRDDSLGVVLDDGGQRARAADILDPLRKLAVPNEGVTTDELAVGLSEIDKVVSSREAERVLAPLRRIPFHGVLRSELTKVCPDDVRDLRDGEGALVRGGAKVLLSVRLELGMYGSRTAVGTGGGSGRGSRRPSRRATAGRLQTL